MEYTAFCRQTLTRIFLSCVSVESFSVLLKNSISLLRFGKILKYKNLVIVFALDFKISFGTTLMFTVR